jgi:aquaporin NIP
MNPARTIGPAIASASYEKIWVYIVGPVVGTLVGAWAYNVIRESDKPLRANSSHSPSFKLCRIKCTDEEDVNNNPHEAV